MTMRGSRAADDDRTRESRGQALRLDSRAIAKQKSLVDSPAMAVMQDAMIV
jgi:hypothetical protein